MAERAQVAIVTGAGSGIGRDFARALLRAGWSVACLGRREAALAETIGATPPDRALCLATDVRDSAAVDAAFAATRDWFGRIDLLFNNAGTFHGNAAFEDMTDDGWSEGIDTNLTGVFHCARAAYRIMKDQRPKGGRIINNGSVSAQVPRPAAAAYTVAKHGLTGLTRQIALEGRGHGIACGQIDIGNVATSLSAHFGDGALQPNGTRRVEPMMDLRPVTEALMTMARMPPDANVLFLTVMATAMPLVGRG